MLTPIQNTSIYTRILKNKCNKTEKIVQKASKKYFYGF